MSEEINKVEQKSSAVSAYRTGVDKVTDTFMQSVEESFGKIHFKLTPEQKLAVMSAIEQMNNILEDTGEWGKNKKGYTWKTVNQSSVKSVLMTAAKYGFDLNMKPVPAYITLKDDKFNYDLQSYGYELRTTKFGVDVKKIAARWAIHEGDKLVLPKHKGLTYTDPEWEETGKGKVICYAYCLEKTDGTFEWLWSWREDVKVNLLAAISNNLLKKESQELKKKLLKQCENLTLDEILSNDDICTQGKVSGAWCGAGKESMILTKMRNNQIMKYPTRIDNLEVAIDNEIDELDRQAEAESTVENVIEETQEAIDTQVATKALPSASVEAFKPKEEPKETVKPTAPETKKTSTDDDLPF